MASNEWLVRKLHEQDKKIEALSRGGTGVGHTSIAPGENLTVISDNGEVVLGAGGVDHVDGPTPATPSAPTLKLGFGTIETTWDGTFAEGEDEDGVPLVAPVDFDVVEVHCSTDPEEEEWGEDTMRGQIKTREGGTVTVGGFDVDDEVFVCLIALAKTGKRSAPSATASLVIEGLDFSALFNELDAANATIKNAGEVLVTEQGTLDEKLTEVDGSLNDLGQDLAAVEDAQAQLNTDLTDVMTSVDGKNTITWNPSAPSAVSNPGKAVGDLWYRTSGNNIIGFWKWDGTDWVTQLLDKTTIPLIDIGAGTFGSLKGARMEANSIAVDKLIVSPNANLISEASFDSGGAGWGGINGSEVNPAAVSFTSVPDGPSGAKASVARVSPPTNDISALTSKSWPFWTGDAGTRGTEVVEGDMFRFVLRARVVQRPTSGVGNLRIRGGFNLNGGSNAWPLMTGNISTTAPLGEWQTATGTWAHPGGSETRNRLSVSVHASNASGAVFEVSFVGMYTMVGSTTIQDGAVSTQKLTADVLEVKNLKATTGQLDEAVINKLFSDVVVAKTAVAEQFIGENAILTGAVTAPKITASEELWAKIAQFVQIRAEHIEADAIDGMVITGPNIRTSASGARVQMDPNGVRVFNADNDVRTHLSPDGSTFKGEVEADTLIVNGGSELRSTGNKLGQGAKLTLESGVTDPTAPPVVQPHWEGIDFDTSDDTGTQGVGLRGLAWDGTYYWTTYAGNLPEGQFSAFRINPADGSVNRYYDVSIGNTTNASEWFGATCIGSELFWLYRDGYEGRILVTDLNLAKKREWVYLDLGYSKTNQLVYKPGIGNDGANVVIAHVFDAGSLGVRTYNKTTGAQIGATVNDSADLTRSNITGVYVGNADWGRKLATVAKASTSELPSFSATTGVYDGAATKFGAATPGSVGVVFHDGKFHTLDPTGTIHESANSNTGDGDSDWWGTYRWSVDADDDGFDDYTSRIGPVKKFTWPLRSKLRFVGAPLPVGVGYITPSIAKKSTSPVRTDFRTPNFSVYAGESAAFINVLPTDWQSGSAPGDSNVFPDAEPSTLVSASSTFQVNGDGSGRWGPLTFNADGTMTSTQIPEWVPITTFASGFEPRSWGFAPAYRVWPDGKVEWRGVVSGSIPPSEITPILTVPSVARPPQPVNLPVAVSGSVGTPLVTRVEFGGLSTPTTLTVMGNGKTLTWVALDGIHYYKD